MNEALLSYCEAGLAAPRSGCTSCSGRGPPARRAAAAARAAMGAKRKLARVPSCTAEVSKVQAAIARSIDELMADLLDRNSDWQDRPRIPAPPLTAPQCSMISEKCLRCSDNSERCHTGFWQFRTMSDRFRAIPVRCANNSAPSGRVIKVEAYVRNL